MYAVLSDVISSYGPQLALWLGWPGLLSGGLVGAALFPSWRTTAIITGAAAGTLLWMACWLTVAMSLRMMGVAS